MITMLGNRMEDLAGAAHVEWHVVCVAVEEAYEQWAHAPRAEAAAAFLRYRAALESEERLSLEYAALVGDRSA